MVFNGRKFPIATITNTHIFKQRQINSRFRVGNRGINRQVVMEGAHASLWPLPRSHQSLFPTALSRVTVDIPFIIFMNRGFWSRQGRRKSRLMGLGWRIPGNLAL